MQGIGENDEAFEITQSEYQELLNASMERDQLKSDVQKTIGVLSKLLNDYGLMEIFKAEKMSKMRIMGKIGGVVSNLMTSEGKAQIQALLTPERQEIIKRLSQLV